MIFSRGHATLKEALSVRWSVMLELKTRKTRIYDTAVVIEKVWGWRWGEAGVGCPCPSVRNDTVTPLVFFHLSLSTVTSIIIDVTLLSVLAYVTLCVHLTCTWAGAVFFRANHSF